MEQYVLMLQADPDDKDLTESMLTEIGNSIPIKFISGTQEIAAKTATWGEPAVILVSDRGAMHKGNEVLKGIKANPAYAHIPLVVLGEVSTPEYIKECYRAGANTFITKPSSIAETRKKIEGFFEYWFEIADTGKR
jgi:response regulator RpfG family c-di-GMP phosphodiesterase